MTEIQRAILDYIDSKFRVVSISEISFDTGLENDEIQAELEPLICSGHVIKTEYDTYRLDHSRVIVEKDFVILLDPVPTYHGRYASIKLPQNFLKFDNSELRLIGSTINEMEHVMIVYAEDLSAKITETLRTTLGRKVTL